MLKHILHRPLLPQLFISALIVAGMHYAALTFSLYWTVEWFDILMHFLGGFVIGTGALFVFFTSGYVPITKTIQHRGVILLIVILSVLVVGLGWEVWELFVGFTDRFADLGDTVMDVIMDTLGAITSFYYAKEKINE